MKDFLYGLLWIVGTICAVSLICILVVDVFGIQVNAKAPTTITVIHDGGYTCITLNPVRGATCTKD